VNSKAEFKINKTFAYETILYRPKQESAASLYVLPFYEL